MEEENVARIHENRDEFRIVAKRRGDVRKTLARVGADCAENRPILSAGNDHEAAVLLVARIERHPGGDARARLHPEVVLILMDGLAASPGV